jgi:hypothetical protein
MIHITCTGTVRFVTTLIVLRIRLYKSIFHEAVSLSQIQENMQALQ